jgi:hypothetical protein
MTDFRQKYIHGESQITNDPRESLRGHFDLLVAVPSWDSRCVAIASCSDLTAEECILLLFPGVDPDGHRQRNERDLVAFTKDSCRRITRVDGPSLSLDATWAALWNAIRGTSLSVGRPLRIALDLSTFPRFYALGTIAGCLKYGYAASISVLYSEGDYQARTNRRSEVEAPDFPFSSGEWDVIPIPFLEGRRAPGRKKYVLVSAGLEGQKTFRVLSREDPDRISLLFGDPGSKPNYPAFAEEQNRALIETYNVPPTQIVRASAGDAISVWKSLSQSSLERPDTENTFYLSCGTKAHALGMALRAVCLEFPCVLYNVPERHNFIPVKPAGRYWTYLIHDLSITQK